MTDWLLALVPQYGLWLLALMTFLSCIALPVPTSILMLTAGGFVAAGDLVLWQVVAAALAGAIAGDQVGYHIGRAGGAGLIDRLGQSGGQSGDQNAGRGKLIGRATQMINDRGDAGIFLTRWLFSPLGPYANFASGAIRFNWLRFTIAAVVGEAIWVGLYVGLGDVFGGNLEAANQFLGSILGVLAGGAVAVGLGVWLYLAMRQQPAE